MQLTIDLDALTGDDLATIDAYLEGATSETREEMVALLDAVRAGGDAPPAALSPRQLARVAQRVRRAITDDGPGGRREPAAGSEAPPGAAALFLALAGVEARRRLNASME